MDHATVSAFPFGEQGEQMLAERQSLSTPIYTGFSSNPWGYGEQPPPHVVYGSLRGLNGGCGCNPVTGCNCEGSGGLHGMGQTASLDQIIANSLNWFSGWIQTKLPPSAAVPPQYGSSGAMMTQAQSWLPYIVIGGLAYLVLRR